MFVLDGGNSANDSPQANDIDVGSFLMFMARTFGQQSSFIYVFGGQPAFAPAMKGFATASGNITSSPGN